MGRKHGGFYPENIYDRRIRETLESRQYGLAEGVKTRKRRKQRRLSRSTLFNDVYYMDSNSRIAREEI